MPFTTLASPGFKGKTDIKKLTAAIDANFALVGDEADAAAASAVAAAASADEAAASAIAIADVITQTPGTVTIVGTDEEDGSASVALQIVDAESTAIEARALLSVWVSSTSFGAPEDDAGQTAFAVATGVEIEEVLDLADYRVLTAATGDAEITLTGADGTYHVMATCNGLVYAGAVTITGNE
jgi:hypothetical protein